MISHNMWRFLDTGMQTAQWNMAVDEVLLDDFKEGNRPIIRLYGWKRALSLGRFSTVSKNLNWGKIQNENIPCVRRMSGGGILIHGGDLSYSLIMPRSWMRGRAVKESYRYVCGFLISLYQKLGHEAQFACDLHLNEEQSDICLAGIEPYDIVIEGKKMGGNAQRYTRRAVFQHGSIPMRIDEFFFESLFIEDSGLNNAATLEKLGTTRSYEELSALLLETFCETFDVELIPYSLNASQVQRAMQLIADKYTQESWNAHGKHTHS